MTKEAKLYFQPGLLSGALTIANIRHDKSRIWTCAEPEFRLSISGIHQIMECYEFQRIFKLVLLRPKYKFGIEKLNNLKLLIQ